MGERGDIIRTMQRAYTERGTAPAIVDQPIYDPATAERPLVGRVVERGLSEEYAERHYIIDEPIYDRTHFAELGTGHGVSTVPKDQLVKIAPTVHGFRHTKRQQAQ